MENESPSLSAFDELAIDPNEGSRELDLVGLQKLVAEQSDLVDALKAQVEKAESDRDTDRLAQEEALREAKARVDEWVAVANSRATEIETLKREFSDQSRQLTGVQSSVRSAEREKDQAVTKLHAYQEAAAEVKRAYDARAAALEQVNTTLVRAEAAALEKAQDAQKLADARADDVDKSQLALAQTFRDFHGLQTAHFALKLENQRATATAKAETAHAVELRRSLEERIQALRNENQELLKLHASTGHHLGRLAESITLQHQTQIGRFDTAVAYLGSLLKSPFVRWSLLWRVRRAGSLPSRVPPAASSPATPPSSPEKSP